MKISENQIRSLVREEILSETNKSINEDKEARLSRRLRRAERLASRSGNDEVAEMLKTMITDLGGSEEADEEGPQSARASDDADSPAALSDTVIDLPSDNYKYTYDQAASNATVASGRDGGDVQLHFTVSDGPSNVGETFALTPGHPLEAELKKQERVMQDLERAEPDEQLAVADVDLDDEEDDDSLDENTSKRSKDP